MLRLVFSLFPGRLKSYDLVEYEIFFAVKFRFCIEISVSEELESVSGLAVLKRRLSNTNALMKRIGISDHPAGILRILDHKIVELSDGDGHAVIGINKVDGAFDFAAFEIGT